MNISLFLTATRNQITIRSSSRLLSSVAKRYTASPEFLTKQLFGISQRRNFTSISSQSRKQLKNLQKSGKRFFSEAAESGKESENAVNVSSGSKKGLNGYLDGLEKKYKETLEKQGKQLKDLQESLKKEAEAAQKAMNEEQKQAGEKVSESAETMKDASSSTKEGASKTSSTASKDNNKESPIPDLGGKQSLIVNIMTFGLLAAVYYYMENGSSKTNEITWSQFTRDLIANNIIQSITVKDEHTVIIRLKKDIPANLPYSSVSKDGHPQYYTFQILSIESFERKLERAQSELGIAEADFLNVTYKRSLIANESIPSLIMNLLLLGVMFYFPYKMYRGMGKMGGAGKTGFGPLDSIFGAGKAKYNEATKTDVTFSDVAGIDEAKQEIMEFVDFLKTPEKYSRLGAKIPKGALLVGPPGTGKTLLAKATAGEANVPFLSMSGSDFVEMYAGVGASRVRDLFAEARKKSPCIIFIDEIDAVAKQRSSGKWGGNDERESTLNQMLVEMDGFKERDGVVVLAGTNRVDILDPALLRPGRFDRQISVDPPDIRGRKDIAMLYLKKMNLDGDIEKFAEKVAELTPGLTGADIRNILNEACINGARRGVEKIGYDDIYAGIDRVLGGIEKKNKVISKEEKRRIAIHEAGHALMGWYMASTDPLLKVTIVPRGPAALGYAQYLPQDIHLYTKSELYEKLCVFLGGRAAEKLKFGEYSTGGADDLEKTTKLCYGMISQYGFGESVGQINYGSNDERYTKPYSESTGQKIDEEVFGMISKAFNETYTMIQEKEKDLMAIADLLLEKETITYEDIQRLLGKRAGVVPQSYQDLIKASWKSKKADDNVCNQNPHEKTVENTYTKETSTSNITNKPTEESNSATSTDSQLNTNNTSESNNNEKVTKNNNNQDTVTSS
ncbi:hypothetical protein WA158_008396 [Blastocystis sp. Blastoise]